MIRVEPGMPQPMPFDDISRCLSIGDEIQFGPIRWTISYMTPSTVYYQGGGCDSKSMLKEQIRSRKLAWFRN